MRLQLALFLGGLGRALGLAAPQAGAANRAQWAAEAERLSAQAATLRAEAGEMERALVETKRLREAAEEALNPKAAVPVKWEWPLVTGTVELGGAELVLRWQLREKGATALEVLDAEGVRVASGAGDVVYSQSRHGRGAHVHFTARGDGFCVKARFESLSVEDAAAALDESAAHLSALRSAEAALAAADPALASLAKFDPPARLFPALNPRSIVSSVARSARLRNRRRDVARARRLAYRTLLRAQKDATYWERVATVAGGDQYVCNDGQVRVLAPSGTIDVTGLAPVFNTWAPSKRATFQGTCDIELKPGSDGVPETKRPRAGGRAGGARKSRRAETAL